jgi:hypothetical protein
MTRDFLLAPPAIVAEAQLPIGGLVIFGGRQLVIFRTYGTDPAAPVILEERSGQYALWSADAVKRLLYGGRR